MLLYVNIKEGEECLKELKKVQEVQKKLFSEQKKEKNGNNQNK